MSEQGLQPGLWPKDVQDAWESHLPALVDGAVGDRARFTGRTVEKDRELVESVLAALVEGMGVKRIATAFGLGHNTVRGIRDRAEKAGKLAPYEERVKAKLRRAIEGGVDAYLEDLEAGKIKGAQTPIPTAIFIDKLRDAEGAPALIIEHRHELSIEGLRAQREALLRGAVDVQSTVLPVKQAVSAQKALDVSSVVADPSSGLGVGALGMTAALADAAVVADPRGGGMPRAGGAGGDDGFQDGKF